MKRSSKTYTKAKVARDTQVPVALPLSVLLLSLLLLAELASPWALL